MNVTKPAGALSKAPFPTRVQRDLQRNKYKYLLMVPVLLYFFLFAYKPMYGLIIAFKDFRPALGIWGSPWAGLKHFRNFFNDVYFVRLIRNTLTISLLTIIIGFPAPIILALLLNEFRNIKFKKTIQTITYMPYFISIVVVCGLIRTYTQSNGIFSQMIVAMGGQPQNLLLNPKHFYTIYILSDVWKNIGWNSIIFFAALASIDQEQFEAAVIDGAGRWRQMLHITLPGIMPTIMILFILRMGSVLNIGHEKIILLYTESTYEVADVISSYVYRKGLENAQYSFSTAVGLFNSLVNVFFLLITNALSRKMSNVGLF